MAKQTKRIPVKNRLGRGLSSLIGPTTDAEPAAPAQDQPPPGRPAPLAEDAVDVAAGASSATLEIPVDQIAPNPHQPRRHFAEADLAELAASISRDGVLQPLLVARAADAHADRPYVLIAGERRLRAARQAGLPAVPCVVRQAGQRQMLEWSLIENIHRADLNPIERAQAYRDYMDRFSLTQAEVAARTAEARATVANYLRLLVLCDTVQARLLSGELTFGHARALAGLAGQPARQVAAAEKVARQGLSVRQTERLVAAVQAGRTDAAGRPAEAARRRPPYLVDVEDRLTEAVGTRVTVRPGRAKNTGRIVVEYYSLDDFDRIARSLGLPEDG